MEKMSLRWFSRGLAIFFIQCIFSTTGLPPKVNCPSPGSAPHRRIEDQDQIEDGVYSPEDYISFSCDEGFSPSGLPEVTCNENGQWDPFPQCVRTQCRLPHLENGQVLESDKQSWSQGEWISFTCDPGYNIHPHSAAIMQCVGSLQGTQEGWDHSLPTCKPVQCPLIDNIENGYITTFGNGTERGEFGIGDNITVTCDDGYTLRGPVVRTCTEAGTWSGTLQICDAEESLCGNPGHPVGGKKEGTSYNEGDKVTFECSLGRTLIGSQVRTCQSNALWSGQEAKCIGKNEYMGEDDIVRGFGTIIGQLSKETTSSNETKQLFDQYSGKNVLLDGEDMINEHAGVRSLSSLRNKHGIDIYFAVDTSKSIPVKDREFAVDVISRIVAKLGIDHARGTIVGLLAFNNTVWYRKIPQELRTQAEVDAALRYIRSQATAGGTGVTKALTEISTNFIPDAKKARQTAQMKRDGDHMTLPPRAIVLFTDGRANMHGDPTEIAKKLKDSRTTTEIYCVGLGDVNIELLKRVATSETPEHLLIAKNLSTVDVVKGLIDNEQDFSTCGLTDQRQQHEGVYAKRRAWPWMVGLYINDKRSMRLSDQFRHAETIYKCGATLLKDGRYNSQWVLTAAHCLYHEYRNESDVMLKFGSIKSSTHKAEGETFIVVHAKKIYLHPSFDPKTLDNDIALINLEEPVQYTAGIRPVCLPAQDSQKFYIENTRAFMTGWGKWNKTTFQKRSPDLKQLTVKLFKHSECLRKLQLKDVTITKGINFCAGGIPDHNNQEMDACEGDSGGPLVTRNGAAWTQIGIVSFGDNDHCRDDGTAGGYVTVSSYVNWIQTIMGARM